MKKILLGYMSWSYSEMEKFLYYGLINQRVFEAFVRIWNWSAPRHGGSISRKHDAFYEKYGAEKYYAKINKVREAFGLGKY